MSTPTVREFGPASRGTLLMNAQLRALVKLPGKRLVLTPESVGRLRRLTEPRTRVPVVRGTRLAFGEVGGRPAEWVRSPRAPRDAGRALLYLHGGGYLFGSPRTHRMLVSRLSHVTATPALSLDYRLAPEHPLAASADDALAAYRWLLERGLEVVVAGDSAGGGLAVRLALLAPEHGLPAPAALVLLSPWADLTCSGDSFATNARADPFFAVSAVRRAAALCVQGGGDAADWRLSPVFGPPARLASLPPMLVQVGSTEVLRDDGARLADGAAAGGASAELEIFDRQPHVPPLYGNAHARRSLRQIGTFVSRVLPGCAPAPPTHDVVAAATA